MFISLICVCRDVICVSKDVVCVSKDVICVSKDVICVTRELIIEVKEEFDCDNVSLSETKSDIIEVSSEISDTN